MTMSSSDKIIGSISETLDKGDFEWTIDACSGEVLRTDYFESPAFLFSSSVWYVRMCLEEVVLSDEDEDSYDEEDSEEEWISIELCRVDSSVQKEVAYSFDMIFQGAQIAKGEGNSFFDEGDEKVFACSQYMLLKNFHDCWSTATKNCIQLTVKIRLRDLVPRNEDTLYKVRKIGTEILRQNYKDLLLHSEDHDLTLKVKDKEFRAHRFIMQFRCPVFKSMLSHDMLEKNRGVVDIPDCDPSAFEQFLLHVYTGKVEVLDKSIMIGLYFIADKYDMENLKEECSAFIKKSLSVHVICDVIKLALNHNDSALLEFATKYFINNAKEILVTAEWQSFIKENPVQANELFIKAFNKSSYCCVRSLKNGAGAASVKKE